MPTGSEAVVIVGATAAGATVTVYACESDPALFVAVTVNEAEPTEAGVPDTTPVVASKLSPAGRAPADTVNAGAVPDAATGEL